MNLLFTSIISFLTKADVTCGIILVVSDIAIAIITVHILGAQVDTSDDIISLSIAVYPTIFNPFMISLTSTIVYRLSTIDIIISGIQYLSIFLDISLSVILSSFLLTGNSLLFFLTLISKYIYAKSPPKKAPSNAILTPLVTPLLSTFIVIYEPKSTTSILTICSINCEYEVGVINLCPCIYPLKTLKNGIIIKQNETALITLAISLIELPPVTSLIINLAIKSAPKNTTKNDIIARMPIIFLPILYALSLASNLSNAKYSLIIIDIAIGIPAVEIFKNKLYIL